MMNTEQIIADIHGGREGVMNYGLYEARLS